MAHPAPLPYAQLFLGMSEQLDRLNTRVQELEQTTQAAVTQASDVSDDMITRLQNFDYLRQSLGDLTQMTDLLSKQVGDVDLSPNDVSNLINQLQMAETKAILGSTALEIPDPLARDSGEALLF